MSRDFDPEGNIVTDAELAECKREAYKQGAKDFATEAKRRAIGNGYRVAVNGLVYELDHGSWPKETP